MPSPIRSSEAPLPYTPYDPDEDICQADSSTQDAEDHQSVSAPDPDYLTLSVGAGAIVGADVSVTLDRYGHLYVGLSSGVSVSPTVVSASLMQGELTTVESRPSESELQSFLRGDSVGASAGAGSAVGVTNSSGGTAIERGMGTPQAGAHFSHNWAVVDTPVRW